MTRTGQGRPSQKGVYPVQNRIFRAFVFWRDGDVEDADEVEVFAPDDAAAMSAARKTWRLTVGAKWPHCRIIAVEVERKRGGVAAQR